MAYQAGLGIAMRSTRRGSTRITTLPYCLQSRRRWTRGIQLEQNVNSPLSLSACTRPPPSCEMPTMHSPVGTRLLTHRAGRAHRGALALLATTLFACLSVAHAQSIPSCDITDGFSLAAVGDLLMT